MLKASLSASLPARASNSASPLTNETGLQRLDSYIVVFKRDVSTKQVEDHRAWLQQARVSTFAEVDEPDSQIALGLSGDDDCVPWSHTLHNLFNISSIIVGYSGHFGSAIIEQIRRHPDVGSVEPDHEVKILSDPNGPKVQRGAPWGLARISQRDSIRGDGNHSYLYASEAGHGVDISIIDSGINIEHDDFEGRASWGHLISGMVEEDTIGHGTHCAGIAAGRRHGIAKRAIVVALKPLDRDHSRMSNVLKAIEYVVDRHVASKSRRGYKGAVANMSIGTAQRVQLLNDAVDTAVRGGVHFAVAAGNGNEDACEYSPAGASLAITVGASTIRDERANFSNHGNCIDVFAPGLDIESTWIGSRNATHILEGTSMASPHIAGLVAYLLSLQPSSHSAYALHGSLGPAKMKAMVRSLATVGALAKLPEETANLLAYNGGGARNVTLLKLADA
ncbi:proteinase B [Oleoguttula sp. CCFEE 5521]